MIEGEREIRISSFSAAVYSDDEQGGNYHERNEIEKGKDGEGRNTDCDGRHRHNKQRRVLNYPGWAKHQVLQLRQQQGGIREILV